MKAKLAFLLILALSSVAFANEGSGSTDILPRTVNFLIFAGILYYLLAEPIKNFFKGRSASIAAQLESVQAKLKETKEEMEKAEAELEKAKKQAIEIVEIAKKEGKILSDKIKDNLEEELKVLEKMHKENCELEERKMVRNLVKNILDEAFEDKNISINEKEFVNLITKKVA
ncbi:F0F1 ATP synthase subunit B [Nitrosophilus kaiyonis]|uniref:F0F1 ATP synthase subunit B n=1 Tax=Nitrosophilus kaiyonis TaxID=2930200 RepID=UPI0024928FCD|nr:F0F1 ATP synthase subunit B [Nitrosophilus kaiyonis]